MANAGTRLIIVILKNRDKCSMSQQKSDGNRVNPEPESLSGADESDQGGAFFVDGHVISPIS